ncbi:hypothetical protein Tco_1137453, partial [Tanacetum coccineum]
MEQYLTFTDHALWEVIVNGDSVLLVASASAGAEGPIPPKTAKQKLARKNELKAKSTLMLAIPNEHLLKFHACKDAKSLWEAIKNSQEGLDKTYDSLPLAWNNIALIMRNKSDLDTLSMDDLYNNLKVYELEIKDSEHIDADDLKEIDLKWQVAMLTMRVKRFIKEKNEGSWDLNDKESVALSRQKVECYNLHREDILLENGRAPRNRGIKLEMLSIRKCTSGHIYYKCLGCSRWDRVHQFSSEVKIRVKTKLVLGFRIRQVKESELNNVHKNESEVIHSVFNSRESDVDDNLVNDRFKT